MLLMSRQQPAWHDRKFTGGLQVKSSGAAASLSVDGTARVCSSLDNSSLLAVLVTQPNASGPAMAMKTKSVGRNRFMTFPLVNGVTDERDCGDRGPAVIEHHLTSSFAATSRRMDAGRCRVQPGPAELYQTRSVTKAPDWCRIMQSSRSNGCRLDAKQGREAMVRTVYVWTKPLELRFVVSVVAAFLLTAVLGLQSSSANTLAQ